MTDFSKNTKIEETGTEEKLLKLKIDLDKLLGKNPFDDLKSIKYDFSEKLDVEKLLKIAKKYSDFDLFSPAPNFMKFKASPHISYEQIEKSALQQNNIYAKKNVKKTEIINENNNKSVGEDFDFDNNLQKSIFGSNLQTKRKLETEQTFKIGFDSEEYSEDETN
ncbi:hypothetical protein MHBO_004485 [Bonamia ostreae]|uniref:Uncharacterized protein n=1 Tax=Bonamia ostreae TaxID=126728 RepID=A0ABV2ATG4_9EUKA